MGCAFLKPREDIEKAIKIPLAGLIEKQSIVQLQMNEASTGYGKCKLTESGLVNLQYMDLVYQAARDIIEFGGCIEDWEEHIKCYYKNATIV